MSDILLKTGTGEVEIIDFIVNERHYAINVLKVREIVNIQDITPLPQTSEEILGLTNIRGEVNTVVDLRMVLQKERTANYKGSLGLLCEFNETKVVFLVDRVNGIKRILWSDIKSMEQQDSTGVSIGTILDENNIIMMLDFESIIIAAHLCKNYLEEDRQKKRKNSNTYIVVVDDSHAIREMIKCTLEDAGFGHVRVFQNGQEAKDYLFELKRNYGKDFDQYIHLLITDIEMPVLDGYTLTKAVKEDPILNNLKVVLFSSLITPELMHKGEAVGADVQISKPSMKHLVEVIEDLLEG